MKKISCRLGCGACCISPSISSAIPGMTDGKSAGVRCRQLTDDYRCRLFGKPGRPAVCLSYQATEEFCGATREDALRALSELEHITAADLP
jgi:Fe-S-cluster containining protein